MKKEAFKISVLMIVVSSLFFGVACAETLTDSLGILGKAFYNAVEKSPLGASGAILLTSLIGFLINRFGQMLFKKLQVKVTLGAAGKLVYPLVWRILSKLWGASVEKYNTIPDPKLPLEKQEIVKQKLIEDAKKHIIGHKGIFKYLDK